MGLDIMNEIHNRGEISFKHTSVMLNEVIEYLALKEGDIVIDCTLGLGGHSEAILKKIGPTGKLIGLDLDSNAIELASQRLSEYKDQCYFFNENFRNINKILEILNVQKVNGILLDIGISSFQLDSSDRGFSLRSDGPLDMRMDQNSKISAFDLVNSLSEQELSNILKNYGEERWHKRIAQNIVLARRSNPIKTTGELRQLIMKSSPVSSQKMKIHPATRSFQALRIAVNCELDSLENFLNSCVDKLLPKARVAIISFHSLEDRIVKNKFRELAKADQLNILTKKPLRPAQEEVNNNSRSRSARLRVAERI